MAEDLGEADASDGGTSDGNVDGGKVVRASERREVDDLATMRKAMVSGDGIAMMTVEHDEVWVKRSEIIQGLTVMKMSGGCGEWRRWLDDGREER